jgi:hypothetical protein
MRRRSYLNLKSLLPPWIAALLPLFFVLFNDLGIYHAFDVILPLLALSVISIVLLILCIPLVGSARKASILASLSFLIFWLFGVITRVIELIPAQIIASRAEGVTLLCSAVVIWIAARRLVNDNQRGPFKFSYISAKTILICFVILIIGRHLYKPSGTKNADSEIASEVGDLPNIYYFVFDGLGRLDLLGNYYRVYTKDLTDGLKDLGFFVAENSFSNYLEALPSVASALNMNYLEAFISKEDSNFFNRAELQRLINNNKVVETLKAQGYRIHSVSSNRAESNLISADERSSASVVREHLISIVFAETPVAYLVHQLGFSDLRFKNHREGILKAFSFLKPFPTSGDPHFIFGHIQAPQPPFVFRIDGKPRITGDRFSYLDGSNYVGIKRSYRSRYSEQAAFILRNTLKVIDQIAKEDPFSIIIVQGSFGPGLEYNLDSEKQSNLGERAAIFNAYRIGMSEWRSAGLHHNISPVNSFRVIINLILGAKWPLLPDKTFYSTQKAPFNFKEVKGITPQISICRSSLGGKVGRTDPECSGPYPR